MIDKLYYFLYLIVKKNAPEGEEYVAMYSFFGMDIFHVQNHSK
ncbi:hypothetical protein CYU10_002351 [Lactococcus lactis subsp. lactis]|uniref:Uncharacterized protein n=1 Tax=Lactococcus lactis subsp. lactis TaxID=1360 RepID=A0A2R7XZY4_LACLL|nr:hypothetical protein CYU10_002351 [Lactococcus lactis subsp. lactis]